MCPIGILLVLKTNLSEKDDHEKNKRETHLENSPKGTLKKEAKKTCVRRVLRFWRGKAPALE